MSIIIYTYIVRTGAFIRGSFIKDKKIISKYVKLKKCM